MKFEHKVFEADAQDYEKIENELIKYSNDGWELVSVINYVYSRGICMAPQRILHYFKRKLK